MWKWYDIQISVSFSEGFIRPELCPFICSVQGCFQWQDRGVATETVWPTKPELFTIWPWQEITDDRSFSWWGKQGEVTLYMVSDSEPILFIAQPDIVFSSLWRPECSCGFHFTRPGSKWRWFLERLLHYMGKHLPKLCGPLTWKLREFCQNSHWAVA